MQLFPPAKLVSANKAKPGSLMYIGDESSWGFAAGKAGIISLSKMQAVASHGVVEVGADFRVQWDPASASIIEDLAGLSRGALCFLATFTRDEIVSTSSAVFLSANSISGTFLDIEKSQQISITQGNVAGVACRDWSIWLPHANGEYTKVWESPKPKR